MNTCNGFRLFLGVLCLSRLAPFVAVADEPQPANLHDIAIYREALSRGGPLYTSSYIDGLENEEKIIALKAFAEQKRFIEWLSDFVAHTTWESATSNGMLKALGDLTDIRENLLNSNDIGCGNYLTAATISWAVSTKLLDGSKLIVGPEQRVELEALARRNGLSLVPDAQKLRSVLLRETGEALQGDSLRAHYVASFYNVSNDLASSEGMDWVDAALNPQKNAEFYQHAFSVDSVKISSRSLLQRLMYVQRLQALCLLALAPSPDLSGKAALSPQERIMQRKQWVERTFGSLQAELLIGPASLSDTEWQKRYLSAKSMLRDIKDFGGEMAQHALLVYLGSHDQL